MKLLIVGKNGQVGRCLVDQINTIADITLLALDREQLDITDAVEVNKIVWDFKPDIIINAAAYTAVDKAEEEQSLAYSINRDGPYNLAMAANESNAVIIHISTDYVFSGEIYGSYVESDKTDPQGEYGRSKLAGEQAVSKSCDSHIILRTAWVFGEYGNNFVKTMLRLGKSRNTLSVVSDQFGAPTYSGDIAKAIIQISRSIFSGNRSFGIYHYSGYPYVNWFQFADEIFKASFKQGLIEHNVKLTPIETKDYPTAAKRPNNSKLNCEKIYKDFKISQSDWKNSLLNLHKY
ncbi:dTDP-4-dehydrorhamnose reductase [Shewanella sp. UCD-KL21]|uniref:dTDP-4-dehydrorhamnose reductase n=1 Tax=Shewanella sp. UCD-KL21 TaxID=1917164 RepID=UPI0009708692|nr:dTDP-4-dehydrorhamnose reductase [Shewanella sp. UCD-KL21]